MALQILMSDKTLVAKRGGFESVMDFYVGGNLPPMEYHDVIEVSAEGAELAQALMMTGIPAPPPHVKSMTFFGDTAKFIAANWY